MANLPKKKVFDTEGNEVLPITHVSAVYDDNGTSVETLLINMDEKIDNKIIEGYYVDGDFYNAPPITHDYVDLGNGVKWATGNLTKDSSGNYSIAPATEYGAYFSWGDIEGHNVAGLNEGYDFSSSNYSSGTSGSGHNLTANFTSGDSTYDAARAKLGSPWRMPTYDEMNWLVSNCTWNWKASGNTDYNGVAGYEVVGANSNKIFLPCAGYYNGTSLSSAGSSGRYLSTRYYSSDLAYSLYFSSSDKDMSYGIRYFGFSVRGIYDGPTPTVIIPVTDAIYIDKATNTQYRWDGTAYAQLTKITYTTIDDEVEDADETIISQALRKTSQSLTSSEKAQVLTNLGISDLISGSLQKTAQVLSSAEKTLVLTNLGISSAKNITISTSEPTSSDGNNGDIWLVYETQ